MFHRLSFLLHQGTSGGILMDTGLIAFYGSIFALFLLALCAIPGKW